MTKHHQSAEDKQKAKKRPQTKAVPIGAKNPQVGRPDPMEMLGRSMMATGSVQAQVAQLTASPLQHAQQQSLVRQLGRAQGNRHLQRVMASLTPEQQAARPTKRGPIIQREDQPSAHPLTLSNARFSGNRTLLRILKGEMTLSSAHNGQAVLRVQQALADMGYPLPQYLVDGKFGSETEEAIRRFRADHGLPPGAEIDADTLCKLDQTVPPPSRTAGKTLDYDRLLADNALTFTLAFGYDKGGATDVLTDRMIDFLLGLGFSGKTMENGMGYLTRNKTFAYLNPETGESVAKEVLIEINLITADTPQAKAGFAEGLSQSDIVIYTGHARYGTGPDFDPKKSAAENFVIGVGSALHKAGRLKTPPSKDRTWYKSHRQMAEVLDGRVNDLEAMSAAGKLDPKKYQVWFFNACTTLHYLDELRSGELVGGKSRENLDILGTRSSVMPLVALEAAQSLISSILGMETLDELMAGMQGTSKDAKPNQFFHEGFGDNPTLMVQP